MLKIARPFYCFLTTVLLFFALLSAIKPAAAEEHPRQASERQVTQQSLDDVIQTLEDSESRERLLDDLRRLQAVLPEEEAAGNGRSQQSVLAVLGEWLTEVRDAARADDAPLASWPERFEAAASDLQNLFAEMEGSRLARFLLDGASFFSIWMVLLFGLMTVARWIARRRGWPRRLPNEAPAFVLLMHLARRFIPWALAFSIILTLSQFLDVTPGRVAVLVLAYVAMVGRLLALAAEMAFSLYTRGHRRVAVSILRERALGLVFTVGCLVALGDALESERLTSLLGPELSELGLIVTSLSAAVLTAAFVLRFKRPIRYLLVNRPYPDRHHHWSTIDDVLRLLGNVWHIPALLLIGASVLAIVMEAGDPGTAITRAMFSATLLVLTLVLTRLIRRHKERRTRRRRISPYQERLEHFGYTLLQIAIWIAFFELTLQIWGMSVLGIGDNGLTARFGQALLAVVVTILIAWLIWILADTAIQRALASTSRARGRQVNLARVQTITPMLRNILLVTILIMALIAVLANLGVNVTPLLAGAGVVGLALGFGAQTLVQDVITGIFILIEDSLAVGDFVEIGGYMGTVEGLTLRTVRLRDLDGILHIITFSQIQAINNMSRQFGIALIRIHVPRSLKVDEAIALMREVATDLRRDPFLGFRIWSALEVQGVERFDEGGAILRARMRTAPEWQWDVARAFNLRLKQRFEQDGIDVAAPRLSVQMETRTEPMDEGRDNNASDASGQKTGSISIRHGIMGRFAEKQHAPERFTGTKKPANSAGPI